MRTLGKSHAQIWMGKENFDDDVIAFSTDTDFISSLLILISLLLPFTTYLENKKNFVTT